jgi:hypothetical protein
MVWYATRDQIGIFRFGSEDPRQLIEISPWVEFDPRDNAALWLEGSDESAKVWLASCLSPINDPKKKLVWKGALFESIS